MMKKRNIILIFSIIGIIIIAGFIFMVSHYKNPTMDLIYNEKVDQYETLLTEYNDAVAENKEKTELYNTELDAYNAAVEADANKEEVPEDGIIKVTVDCNIYNEENSVGNEWDYVVQINGNPISTTPTEISINAHNPLTVYAKATEKDDAVSDVGTSEEQIHYTNEEIIEGLVDEIYVSVREDAGRYTGNVANITVSLNIKRVIDQVIIPPKPEEPTLISIEQPIHPIKSDINVTAFDVLKYNNGVLSYAILSFIILIVMTTVFVVKNKK